MREKWERVAGLVRKEFRQLFRDPRMSRMIFVSPIDQLIIFGYAVSTDVRHTPLYVVDHDRTAASRALVDALTAGEYFRVVGRSDRARDLAGALDHGRATVGIQIPPCYARALRGPDGARVQLLVDGIARSYWDSGTSQIKWHIGETAAGLQIGHADVTDLVFSPLAGDDICS